MPRTAASIITSALQIAKCPHYTAQGLAELNSLLAHIAATIDFSAARGQWNFTFNSALSTTAGGNIVTSGPNPLPIDYLRVGVSGGSTGAQRSSKWYLQGVPYDMVEIDLYEFDDQVQQAGMQSYPYFWAKDPAPYQPIIEVTSGLNAGSAVIGGFVALETGWPLTRIAVGMSVAGGMGPISAIPPGTTITALATPISSGGTMSAPATASLQNATLLIGNPGAAYAYPPPSGAYNAMIRYQRRMPRLTQIQVDTGAYCWFDDDMALIDGLAGLMCKYTDDTRVSEFIGGGLGSNEGLYGKRIAQYLKLANDNANRASIVQLDRRIFGAAFSSLRNTKQVGF